MDISTLTRLWTTQLHKDGHFHARFQRLLNWADAHKRSPRWMDISKLTRLWTTQLHKDVHCSASFQLLLNWAYDHHNEVSEWWTFAGSRGYGQSSFTRIDTSVPSLNFYWIEQMTTTGLGRMDISRLTRLWKTKLQKDGVDTSLPGSTFTELSTWPKQVSERWTLAGSHEITVSWCHWLIGKYLSCVNNCVSACVARSIWALSSFGVNVYLLPLIKWEVSNLACVANCPRACVVRSVQTSQVFFTNHFFGTND